MTRLPDDRPETFEEALFAVRLALWDFYEVCKSAAAEMLRVVVMPANPGD